MKNSFYNKKYFRWQSKVGVIGGEVNLFKFEKEIKISDRVIDFGCGGGYLLSNIMAEEKIGIEINKNARVNGTKLGLKIVDNLDKIADGWADVIISNHVLEHVDDPLGILKIVYKKLKKGGKVVFVVPYEIDNRYIDDDINNHMYTWGPLNLANLFKRAGFKIRKAEVLRHQWPPYYYLIYKVFGKVVFHWLSYVYCYLSRKIYQTRVVAQK